MPARAICCLVLALATTTLRAAGFDQDAEARALRQWFSGLTIARTALKDDFDGPAERRLTGLLTVTEGALHYPEDRSAQVTAYYGVVLPRRGRLAVDFRVDQLPGDYSFMTICAAGTAGNTKFTVRLGLDRRVRIMSLTRREAINLESDPVALGQRHHLEWWWAPEGALLVVDGVLQDYATDCSVPYAVEGGEAFWLGDQPWWDPGGHQGVFYPLDSFVGILDNLELVALK